MAANFQSKFDSVGENLVVGFDRTADCRIKTVTGESLSETLMLSRAMAAIQSGRFIEWWPSRIRWASIPEIKTGCVRDRRAGWILSRGREFADNSLTSRASSATFSSG
jgi:hypothetical protein